jgi:hypothetical protein
LDGLLDGGTFFEDDRQPDKSERSPKRGNNLPAALILLL